MDITLIIWRALAMMLTLFYGDCNAVRTRRQSKASSSATQMRCVSELPRDVLYDSAVLEEEPVKKALQEVKTTLLGRAFNDSNPDALSMAIVHSSRPEPILTFNHGALRLNETSEAAPRSNVTSDSIFRVNSISKAMVALTAVIMQQKTASCRRGCRITWSTRVADILPDFGLPPVDWDNGGSEITLGMLATELSGLRREGYANGFDLRKNNTRATASALGTLWSQVTPADVLYFTRSKGLLWAPGERPSYSNAGFSILGYALAAYARSTTTFRGSWSDLATIEILECLNMAHSFFGSIPTDLREFISVPGVPNWVDIVIHDGYDPAAGMFSSASDLAKVVHHVYLKETPELISSARRRDWMRPGSFLSDGVQAVGPGWEIQNIHDGSGGTYQVYGKEGDGGGQHSYIDALPELKYGVVVLLSESDGDGVDYTTPFPVELALSTHEILAPAFRSGYSSLLSKTYAGTYTAAPGHYGSASIDLSGDSLYLANMTFDGVDALQRIDELSWTATEQPRLFSAPGGPSLHPSDLRGEWHMAIDGDTCDWFDFDGYTDANGDPVDGIALEKDGDRMRLTYKPLDAVFYRDF